MTSTTSSRHATVHDPLVGRLLDGRYQITDRLARGGMATVYRAVDTRLTRTVAVKIMHIGLGDDVEFARKFDREARAAARLSHPHVVSVFDQGQDVIDSHVARPYIVMEYVEGQTLRDVITAHAPMDPVDALDLLEPVAAALAAAHDAGLVHRDVKPENVLLGPRGRVKVADFGLAKAISSQTQTATQGLLIGTVSYLPPELVLSGHADARSDVYSAGVVLFELLTGRKPHTGDTPIQVAYAHVHRDVPAPSGFATVAEIPAYLDALVARATARDPDLRPPDGRVLLTQLRRVRAALHAGVRDDPELTQDLRPMLTAAETEDLGSGSWTEVLSDRADVETTQWVGPGGPDRPPPPDRPSHYTPPGPTPPRATQAPPPTPVADRGGRPSSAQAERIATHRARAGRRRRRGWLVLLLVLLLTTGAALTGWYLTEGRYTSAPALVSLPRDEAGRVAERANLRINFSADFSENVPPGAVISTEPGAGTKVARGGQIDAVLSKGPERFSMPTVVGLSQADAASALEAKQLRPGRITQRWSDTVGPGIVVAADRRAGAALKRDTAVGLAVSRGPQPVTVPDLVGQDADGAVAKLEKSGLAVTVGEDHSDTVKRGKVMAQDPKSGMAAKGTTITVTRSLGPVQVTVPNVQAMGVRAAKATMKAAGFKTEIKPVSVNYIGVGFVVYTSPGSGRQAPKGSTITLYVV